jgi:hypothetical protein
MISLRIIIAVAKQTQFGQGIISHSSQENKTGERPPRGKPFVKGHEKTGGRKKGARNLMTTDSILKAAALQGGKDGTESGGCSGSIPKWQKLLTAHG